MKKNIKWILIAVGVVLVAGAGYYFYSHRETAETVTEYENLINEADLLYNSRSYTKALSSYDEAVDLLPSRIDAYKGIVTIFIDKGRLSDAEEIITGSTQKLSISDRSILYSMLGNAYYNVEGYSKALDMYDSATTIGVTNLVASLGEAKVYLKQNEISKAENILKDTDFKEDTLYEAKLLYAYIVSIEDPDSAASILKSVDVSDDWSNKYTEFENTLASLTDDELYNAAKLSKIFINEGYPYLAISVLTPLKDQMTEYADGLYFLGRASLDTGSTDDAITLLKESVSAGSLDPDLFRTIARAYYEKKDNDTAISYYDRAISYSGEEVKDSLLKEYLDFLIDENLLTKAQEVLTTAQKYFDKVWVEVYAIKINYLLKDTDKVDYYIAEALKKEDITTEEKKTIYYWKAVRAIDDEDLDSASEILASLKELDRFNPYYYLLMGKVLYENGNFDDAKTNYELAIEYDLGEGVSSEAEKALARID